MKRWRVLLLDTKKSNPNHYICLAIGRALAASPCVEMVVKTDYRMAVRDAVRHGCDLFIAFDGEELDRSFVEKLTALCLRKVMWVTEDPYERSVNAANADLFDLVFTNDFGSVSVYGDKGRHLAFAADERFHLHTVPASDTDHYLYDLFFAGTPWPNRAAFLERLQRAIPTINLKLALPRNPFIPEPKLGIEPSAYDWRTPNTEFAKFANRSRSVLTLHREFSASGNDPVAQTPGPRFFEVALAGGFQLVDTSNPEIRVDDFYSEGQDYVGFRNVEDCIDKLEYYLARPAERLAIAKSAQQATLAEHLYSHRVEKLLSAAAKLPSKAAAVISPDGSKRRRILVVSHNILGSKPYGGVEVYQDIIRKSLGSEFEFLFYTPGRNIPGNSTYVLRDENLNILQEFHLSGGLDEGTLSCPEREATFSRIIRGYAVDVVHFQHLLGHPPSLALLPRSLGVGSLLSLHDYYAICSRFNLLDYRGTYCNIACLPIETCDVCLNAAHGFGAGSQARRRAFFSRVLRSIDVLHANTEGVAGMYYSLYPALQSIKNIRVCGVPMPAPAAPTDAEEPERDGSQPLRIAIPGNIAPNKGGAAIIHVIEQLRRDPVEFTIFGNLSPDYADVLKTMKVENLKIHGEFAPGQLPSLLRSYDISLHFSNWPETYCISLSEAWSAGVVPIVSDIGALGERVENGVNGFKVPTGEAGSVVALLRRIIADRSLLEQIKPALSGSVGVGRDEHSRWLASIYKELMPLPSLAQEVSPISGTTVRELGFLLVDERWIVPGGPSRASGAFPASLRLLLVMAQGLHFNLRTYGARRTLAKVIRRIKGRLRANR